MKKIIDKERGLRYTRSITETSLLPVFGYYKYIKKVFIKKNERKTKNIRRQTYKL